MSNVAAYFVLCVGFPFLLAYAAASDLLTMRISNRVTGLVAAGFAINVVASGMPWSDFLLHLAAGALTLVVTFAMFARGWMGGGDAKLATGTALWLGMEHLLEYVVLTSILGGVLTLAILYARTYPLPRQALRFPFVLHLHNVTTGIPYGIALSAAALIILPGLVDLERLTFV